MTEQLCDFPTCQLARQKGFDEWTMRGWELTATGPQPVQENNGVEAFDMLHAAYLNVKDDPRGIDRLRKFLADTSVCNSRLPPNLFARPTQDLLERWLREVHGIDIVTTCYAKASEGRNAVYRGTVTRLEDVYVDHTSNKTMYVLAREAAIVHALKLLPDAPTKG